MYGNFIIAGLSLGVISSFHCVGMCGPIAFALPVQHLHPLQKRLAIFGYHGGRILTYALLGAVFGLLGRQVFLAGFQRWFSIGLGILVLLLLIQYLNGRKKIQPGFMDSLQRKVQQWMGYFMKQKTFGSYIFLGMANGLLPCGMVYLAIAGALSANQLSESILFMTAFGLGTFPAMILLSFFGMMAGITVRNRIKAFTPYVIAFMGILLILRGLNLGIPYISPMLESSRGATISCH